ncbi:MAG: thioredoxin domain-containing protein, partial [Candidatus Diapherotrites archaeon]
MRKILLAIAMVLVLATNVFAAIPTLGDPYLGESNAPVKVIQFVDFSDADDRDFMYEVLIPLWSDYIDAGKVQLIVKDFASDEGFDAANAAECADDYGKFTQFYVGLFNRYNQWAGKNDETQKNVFEAIAQYNGITNDGFTRCLENNAHLSEITDDYQDGKANGVYDTPTVFVNGKKLFDPNYNTLIGEIEAALNKPIPSVPNANIIFTSSGKSVNMEKNGSTSVTYTLKNTGGTAAYVTLSTSKNSKANYVSSSVNTGGFSLAPGNSKDVTVNITTTNAPNGTYGVNLRADYDGKGKIVVTTVNVNTPTPPVNANIEFSPSGRTVTMDRYDSDSVSYDVRNTGDQETYVDLSVSDNSSYINSSVNTDRFWLGADSSKSVTVYIETNNANTGTYNVELEAKYINGPKTENITVYVNADGPITDSITLDATYKTVCRGEYNEVNVEIKNNANYGRDIELSAEPEMFLPYFTDKYIYLSAYDSEDVTLKIWVPDRISTGTKYINIYAKSGSKTYSDTARIYVKDCGIPNPINKDKEFTLTLQSSCKRIEKGEKTTYTFTLKNITNDDIRVDLQVVSDLPTELKDHVPVYLDSYERVTLEFEVKSRKTDDTGRHEIIVYAWDDDYNTKESTCVYLEGTNEVDVDLVNNDLKIERGKFEVFTLLVENTGDFEENVDIEVNDYFEGIEVTISD